MRATLRWLRRRLPVLLSLLVLAWIITVFVLITLNPAATMSKP
jgi:hypothetical protein